jgi:hypothetical protein
MPGVTGQSEAVSFYPSIRPGRAKLCKASLC